MVDILPGIKDVDFDSAWDRRMEIAIDAEQVPIFPAAT